MTTEDRVQVRVDIARSIFYTDPCHEPIMVVQLREDVGFCSYPEYCTIRQNYPDLVVHAIVS